MLLNQQLWLTVKKGAPLETQYSNSRLWQSWLVIKWKKPLNSIYIYTSKLSRGKFQWSLWMVQVQVWHIPVLYFKTTLSVFCSSSIGQKLFTVEIIFPNRAFFWHNPMPSLPDNCWVFTPSWIIKLVCEIGFSQISINSLMRFACRGIIHFNWGLFKYSV